MTWLGSFRLTDHFRYMCKYKLAALLNEQMDSY